MKKSLVWWFALILIVLGASFDAAPSPKVPVGSDKQTIGPLAVGPSAVTYFSAQTEPSLVPEKGPLLIVDHGPTNELPAEMIKPTVYVMFNHPMVPLGQLGQPILSTTLMTIEPAVNGIFRWYGTRSLSFEPTDPMTSHGFYTVTIPASAQSLGGSTLGKDYQFSFHSEPVTIMGLMPGRTPSTDTLSNQAPRATEAQFTEIPPSVARFVILEFNQPVDLAAIQRSLTVQAGDAEVHFTLSRPVYPAEWANRAQRAVLLTLAKAPAQNVSVTITLAAGAEAQLDFPGRDSAQTVFFQTLTPFVVQGIQVSSWDFPDNNNIKSFPLDVVFSHPLEKDAASHSYMVLLDGVPVTPVAVTSTDNDLQILLPHAKPGQSVEVDLPADLHDKFGRLLDPKATTVTNIIPSPNPYAMFPWRFNQLEAAYPPKFIYEARNLDTLSLGAHGTTGWDFGAHFDTDPQWPVAKPVLMSHWPADKVHYGVVDLAPYLTKGYGTVNFNAQWSLTTDASYPGNSSFAIQVTDIGITTRYAYNRLLVWVNHLSTGLPIAKARVVWDIDGRSSQESVTNNDGLSVIELGPGEFSKNVSNGDSHQDKRATITVFDGRDRADLPVQDTQPAWGASIATHANPWDVELPVHRVYLFTDRDLYKAGDVVALRGIDWIQTLSSFATYQGPYSLALTNSDTQSVVWTQTGTTTESGGLAQKWTLPSDLDPGEYDLDYQVDGIPQGSLSFSIGQYRNVTFEVNTTVPPTTLYQGDTVKASVAASYLSGGALRGAPYQVSWTRQPTGFVPDGDRWSNWAFGPDVWEGSQTLADDQGKLDDKGQTAVSASTAQPLADGATYAYTVETTVQSVDRQAISSSAQIVVHPASFDIGAQFASNDPSGWWSRFVPTGKDTTLKVALVDASGRPWDSSVPVTVRVLKQTWVQSDQQGVADSLNSQWTSMETEVQNQTLTVAGLADWVFQIKDGGDYAIELQAKDSQGRTAKTRLDFYATGSDWVQAASETPSTIKMIVDKTEYLPGETARILVQTPVADGKYLMTIEREGIQEHKIIEIHGGQTLLEVPIKESYLPIIYVALSSFTKRTTIPQSYIDPDLGRPRSLFGIVGIPVSTKAVQLTVATTMGETHYRPGQHAQVTISVSRDGQPVAGAEVTVLAVDRGVLDLTGYHVPDPLSFFYSPSSFPLGVRGDDSRRLLMRPVTFNTSNLTGGASSKMSVRKAFQPLALFEPFAKTDSHGNAVVHFILPDSLTAYRLTAVAVKGTRVGIHEAEFKVSNPINVRAALPRKLRSRDTADAGVVVQNLTDEAQMVTIGAASDLLTLSGSAQKTVTVAPQDSQEVAFTWSATHAGKGTVTFTVHSSLVNEELISPFEVEEPRVTEAFTTIGTLGPGNSQAQEMLRVPDPLTPGFGGLTLRAGASYEPYVAPALGRLLDTAKDWDRSCFYDQLTSAFALVVKGDHPDLVQSFLKVLASFQLADGSITPSQLEPRLGDPELTALALFFEEFAHERGVSVVDGAVQATLANFLRDVPQQKKYTPYFRAFTALALAKIDLADPASLQQLESLGDALGLGGYGLLAQAFLAQENRSDAQKVFDRAKNFVRIGTQSVDVKETYEAADPWSTDETALALLLKNAIDLGQDEGLIQRLARSLHKSESTWPTRNDDLWTLLGFLPLLDAEHPNGQPVQVVVSSPHGSIATLSPTQADPEPVATVAWDAPALVSLPRGTNVPLTLKKSGTDEVAYAATITYALPSETISRRDEGIEVDTRYETLGGKSVRPDQLILGQVYRVRVDVSSPQRRARLDLTVPIPSGVEILDPSYATTGHFATQGGTDDLSGSRQGYFGDTLSLEQNGTGGWDDDAWAWYWYDPDTSVYDNMMVYRWTDYFAGQRTVSFLVRVTTPGIYPTPGASARLEFEPEVFGRSQGQLFVVKP